MDSGDKNKSAMKATSVAGSEPAATAASGLDLAASAAGSEKKSKKVANAPKADATTKAANVAGSKPAANAVGRHDQATTVAGSDREKGAPPRPRLKPTRPAHLLPIPTQHHRQRDADAHPSDGRVKATSFEAPAAARAPTRLSVI
jgi:hypothetical protein